jgi:hypothetical protein
MLFLDGQITDIAGYLLCFVQIILAVNTHLIDEIVLLVAAFASHH